MSQPAKKRPRQRARLVTAILGIVITLLVIVLDVAGVLAPFERWCFDRRVAWCQRYLPAPTKQLVQVEITDDSLVKIGRWPWDRWKLAWIIDELRLAGAQVIALDIFFNERQVFIWPDDPVGDDPGFDAALAAAMKRHGNVIIAVDPSLGEPIDSIRDAAADLGLVKYPQSPDGVSRFVSLRYRKDSYDYTHMALVLATRFLGAQSVSIVEGDDQLAFDTPGGQIVVPVHDLPTSAKSSDPGLFADMFVPWFGPDSEDGWGVMFDRPNYENKDIGRVSILIPWNVARDDHAINQIARVYQLGFTRNRDEQAIPRLSENAPRAAREAFIDLRLNEVAEMLDVYDGDDLTDEEKLQRRQLLEMQTELKQLRANTEYIERKRAALREKINGKAVLVGYTVTGLMDQTPTPLHPAAPGVTVHGAIFNGILTGEHWHAPPHQYTLFLTLALGILTACLTTLRGPLLATVAAAGLAAGYVLINGYILFDANNLILGVAAPLTAVVVVWAGCTVSRFVIERHERARVEKRFRSYVDPTLVDYVLEHPEKSRLDGERRELTVVFTDLAGFTTLSEELRERTVPLLSEYFERMVPLIRENDGYVNKFLGDGMMFFYGAPLENQGHAIHAVSAVLRMQESLLEFNELLTERELPLLGMRAGIGSGHMTVGDAGPADASDYTVLGDEVNLAARLESANKATDTQVLINNRAAELVGEHFLLRPIGNLQVVGKTEGVFVYEPLCRIDEAEDEQRQLADDTLDMINAFVAGQFAQCLDKLGAFEAKYGPDKLTQLYRGYCEQFITQPPGDEFTGKIVLTEK